MATTHQTILELAEDLRVATGTLNLKQLHLKFMKWSEKYLESSPKISAAHLLLVGQGEGDPELGVVPAQLGGLQAEAAGQVGVAGGVSGVQQRPRLHTVTLR